MSWEKMSTSSHASYGVRTGISCWVCRLWCATPDTQRLFFGPCMLANMQSKRVGTAPMAVSPSAAWTSSRRRPSRQPEDQATHPQLGQPPQGGIAGNVAIPSAGSVRSFSQRLQANVVNREPRAVTPSSRPQTLAHLDLLLSDAAIPDLNELNVLMPAFSLDDIFSGNPLPLDLSTGVSETADLASSAPRGSLSDAESPDQKGQLAAIHQNMHSLKRRALRPWERSAAPATVPELPQPTAPLPREPSRPSSSLPVDMSRAVPSTALTADQSSVVSTHRRTTVAHGRGTADAAAGAQVTNRAPGNQQLEARGLEAFQAAPHATAPTAPPNSFPTAASVDSPLPASDLYRSRSRPSAPKAVASDPAEMHRAVHMPSRPSAGRLGSPTSSSHSDSTTTITTTTAAALASLPPLGTSASKGATRTSAHPAVGGATQRTSTWTAASINGADAAVEAALAGATTAASCNDSSTALPAALSATAVSGRALEPGLGAMHFPGAAPLVGISSAPADTSAAAAAQSGVLEGRPTAGEALVRSTRAPRSARVRSREWMDAARAVETPAAAATDGSSRDSDTATSWHRQLSTNAAAGHGAAVGGPARPGSHVGGFAPNFNGTNSWQRPGELELGQLSRGGQAGSSGQAVTASASSSSLSSSSSSSSSSSPGINFETVSEPRGVLVLHEAPLRDALEAASAVPRPSRKHLPHEVTRHNWRLHAAGLFPELYDAGWHSCLFDFFFELWPEVGRAHVTASGGTSSRRLLLTSDAEVAAAMAADVGGMKAAAAAVPPGPPPARVQRAAELLHDAYAFAARCYSSKDFSVCSAVVVSVTDCMDDYDGLLEQLAARLPPLMVQRLLVPMAPRFQPQWVVEEFLMAVSEAHPGYSPVGSMPGRWLELMSRLEAAEVVFPGGGRGVVFAVLESEEGAQRPQPQPQPRAKEGGSRGGRPGTLQRDSTGSQMEMMPSDPKHRREEASTPPPPLPAAVKAKAKAVPKEPSSVTAPAASQGRQQKCAEASLAPAVCQQKSGQVDEREGVPLLASSRTVSMERDSSVTCNERSRRPSVRSQLGVKGTSAASSPSSLPPLDDGNAERSAAASGSTVARRGRRNAALAHSAHGR